MEASDEFDQLVDNIDDLNMQQALKDFKIDAREITIDIKGNRFASKMIDVLKNEDPNYTKMLELTDFADLLERIDMDPSLLLKYLDDYQISVVT